MTDDQRELVSRNLPLAWHAAGRAFRLAHARGEPLAAALEDLHQDAVVALCRAAREYDPARGARFSTFASHVIANHLRDAMRRHRLIACPRAAAQRERFRERIRRTGRPASLGHRPSGGPLATQGPAWEAANRRDEQALLLRLLLRLRREDPRACRVLLLRGRGMTLKEVGAALGCTKQRAQQVEGAALARLRCWAGRAPCDT